MNIHLFIYCVLILVAVIFLIVSFYFCWSKGFSKGFSCGWYDGKDDIIKYGKPKDDKKQRRDKRGRFIK